MDYYTRRARLDCCRGSRVPIHKMPCGKAKPHLVIMLPLTQFSALTYILAVRNGYGVWSIDVVSRQDVAVEVLWVKVRQGDLKEALP